MGRTKREHYIPRMILRRHAISSVDNCVWLYDKCTGIEETRSIKDVVVSKNLYELRDSENKIIKGTENIIEDSYGNFEKEWAVTLDKVDRHADLTDQDRSMLYFLLVVQLCRVPWMIGLCCKPAEFYFKGTVDARYIKNLYKIASSLAGDLTPEAKPVLASVVDGMCSLDMVFVESFMPFVLPMDIPVFAWKSGLDQYYFFPYSSHRGILLKPKSLVRSFSYVSLKYTHTVQLNRKILCSKNRYYIGSARPSGFVASAE